MRPRTFEADELRIGRGADCDIRLPDLAVSLNHAVIRREASGRVTVAAVEEDGFDADGVFTREARLDLASPHTLTFGSHVLTVAAAHGGDVAIEVVRKQADAAPQDVAEARSFTLASTWLDKRRTAWALAVAILLVGLLLPAGLYYLGQPRIHLDQQWSTGRLSEAHAFLKGDCTACHRHAFVAVEDHACLSCHGPARSQAPMLRAAAEIRAWGGPAKVAVAPDHADPRRLADAIPPPQDHGRKITAAFEQAFHHPNDRCASCHFEHLGARPTTGEAGALAPGAPAVVIAHSCVECHSSLRSRLSDTALRDAPDWRHHPEFKAQVAQPPTGGTIVAQRISLTERPVEYTGLTFSHQIHLDVAGGVARMARDLHIAPRALPCAACHHSNDGGRTFAPVRMERDCAACHSLAFGQQPGGQPLTLPHGDPLAAARVLRAYYSHGGAQLGLGESTRRAPGFLITDRSSGSGGMASAARVAAVLGRGGVCSECHVVGMIQDRATLAFTVAPTRLTRRYLPLGGFDHSVRAHRLDAYGRPTCETCHKAEASGSASDVMIPRVFQCAQCHGRSKATSLTPASADCAECHAFHAPGAPGRRDPAAAKAGETAAMPSSWSGGGAG